MQGLTFLDLLLDHLNLRLESLVRYLVASISALKNKQSGLPYVKVLSRTPFHVDRQRAASSNDPNMEVLGAGSIISLTFLDVSYKNMMLFFSVIMYLFTGEKFRSITFPNFTSRKQIPHFASNWMHV